MPTEVGIQIGFPVLVIEVNKKKHAKIKSLMPELLKQAGYDVNIYTDLPSTLGYRLPENVVWVEPTTGQKHIRGGGIGILTVGLNRHMENGLIEKFYVVT